ncbi:MAG: phage terminase small subunit P27 family [Fuerstiella sp.]
MGSRGPISKPKDQDMDRLLGKPIRPRWLEGEAKRFWDRHASLLIAKGWLTKADADSFALLCQLSEQIHDAQAVLKSEGLTVPTGTGSTRAHPATTIRADCQKQFVALSREFNLTPVARLRSGEPVESEQPPQRMRRQRDLESKYL